MHYKLGVIILVIAFCCITGCTETRENRRISSIDSYDSFDGFEQEEEGNGPESEGMTGSIKDVIAEKAGIDPVQALFVLTMLLN
jgi:hypothetical protein